MLLWEPTAPSPVETVENIPYGVGLSVASQLINTYSKDSFSQFRSSGPDGELTNIIMAWLQFKSYWPLFFPDETSGSDEETMHYYTPASDPSLQSRKKKKPKAQSKTSQSLFSVIVSVNHGLIALQVNAMVNAH